MERESKKPSFSFALFSLLFIIAFITCGLIIFKIQLHVLMFCGWILCAVIGSYLGFSFNELEKGAFELIHRAMTAIIILIFIGALIGAWISSGTVPLLIYAGLKIISPSFFLITSLIVCSFTSIFTGTSWGTLGTVGIALMGIGSSLGFAPGLTAASIICGSFFGDKMSPLSDTTVMTAAVCNTPLLRHVRHMWYTILPAYLITFVIYLFLGINHQEQGVTPEEITLILNGLSEHFNLGIGAFLPMLLVLLLLLKRFNPILAIALGALAGVFAAIIFNDTSINSAFSSLWKGFSGSFPETPVLEKLLNRGGITSMLNVVCLVILACGLGGMLRQMEIIQTAIEPLANWANTNFKLVLSTLIVGYCTHILTAATYFSIIMTGTLMTPIYRKQGLRPENCSRVIEDAGTIGGPLIPWSNNALFPMAALSVTYTEYIPYVFLLYLTPCFSLLYAYFNINMPKLTEEDLQEEMNNQK